MLHVQFMFFPTWKQLLHSNARTMSGLQINIKLTWLGAQLMATQPTESVKAACLGANPRLSLASSGDRHRTYGEIHD